MAMITAVAAAPGAQLWALRAVWVVQAPLAAVAVQGAVAGGTGSTVAAVLWWLIVAAGLVAVIVPSTVGLTAMRMVAPLAVGVHVAALVGGAPAGAGGAALMLGLVGVFLTVSGEVAEAFVQASAYGRERRFPLRAPAAVLPAAGLVWAVWAAAALSAGVCLASERWVPGVVLAVVAGAITWPAGRRLHTLARRWLVVVPAGVVVHDGLVLGETLMVPRQNVAAVRLAPVGTQALDLTGPAGGHALEVVAKELLLAHLATTRAQPAGSAVHVQSFLVAPVRPGRALTTLTAGKLPVG